jgi:gliding motility-associated-like protein
MKLKYIYCILIVFSISLLNVCSVKGTEIEFSGTENNCIHDHSNNDVTDSPFSYHGIPETEEQEIVAVLNTNNVSCTSLGSASVNIISSCTGSPVIRWSNGLSGNNVLNLAAGNYSVTISDGGGCTNKVIDFEIQEANFQIVMNVTGNLCLGPVTVTAEIIGANPNFVDFLWSTAQTTQSISVNTEGSYTVTASYGTCSATKTIDIAKGDFFNIAYNPYICQNSSSSAIVNFINAENPANYTFEWFPSGSISQGIDIHDPGTYGVTVTHIQSGCSAYKEVNVVNAPVINLQIDSENISCRGMADGSATALPSGGMGDFTYLWSIFRTDQTINGLISGNYAVTVTDSIGCNVSATVYISEPDTFRYTISPFPSAGFCYGGQATIGVTAEGGTPPYIYTWDDGFPSQAGRIVAPTVTTSYSVTVTDNNGCTAPSQTTTIYVSQPMTLSVETTDPLCYGLCEGTATLSVTGGIPYMQYSWDSNTDHIEGLCAGLYSVTVTDMYNCSAHINFVINQPDTLQVTLLESGNVSCYGYDDGYVEVEVIGGKPFTDGNYRYRWSSGHTIDSTNVSAGTYVVTISDANGCSITTTANPLIVTQPEAVYVTFPNNGIICIGELFSTIVHATGGEGTYYTFTWYGSDGSMWHGAELNVRPRVTTSYTVSVTDSKGCIGPSRTTTVTVRPPIDISSIESSSPEVCTGDGLVVNFDVSGGNGGPYNVYFQSGAIINTPYTFYPTETGYYRFMANDDCGSPLDKDSIYVIVHPLPDLGFHSDKTVSCPMTEFTFTEITQDLGQTYAWNFGDGGTSSRKNPTHIYRESGLYDVTLTVTSVNGCKNTQVIEDMIEIYNNPVANFVADPEFTSALNAYITLHNRSVNGVNFYWDFGDESSALWINDERVIHHYTDVGEYIIMLVAQSENECVDTIYKKIRINEEITFYAPTAFSPNGDGTNDFFYIFANGIDSDQFHLTIHDRYGNRVFEAEYFDMENPLNMAWDGTYHGNLSKGDKPLENGIYVWRCSFVDINGKPHEKSGTVTLIR